MEAETKIIDEPGVPAQPGGGGFGVSFVNLRGLRGSSFKSITTKGTKVHEGEIRVSFVNLGVLRGLGFSKINNHKGHEGPRR